MEIVAALISLFIVIGGYLCREVWRDEAWRFRNAIKQNNWEEICKHAKNQWLVFWHVGKYIKSSEQLNHIAETLYKHYGKQGVSSAICNTCGFFENEAYKTVITDKKGERYCVRPADLDKTIDFHDWQLFLLCMSGGRSDRYFDVNGKQTTANSYYLSEMERLYKDDTTNERRNKTIEGYAAYLEKKYKVEFRKYAARDTDIAAYIEKCNFQNIVFWIPYKKNGTKNV